MLGPAQQPAGQLAGWLAVFQDYRAVADRRDIALGALVQTLSAARQIVDDVRSVQRQPLVVNDVDMGAVAVPHFGIHLSESDFETLKARLAKHDIDYIDPPYRRFKGNEFEQETFFIKDPNGNVMEIKTMVNPEVLFKSA